MKGLLRSTWSGLSSLSRRAVAEVGARYAPQPSLPSQESVYLLPGWAVKRRHQVEAKGSDRESGPDTVGIDLDGCSTSLRSSCLDFWVRRGAQGLEFGVDGSAGGGQLSKA